MKPILALNIESLPAPLPAILQTHVGPFTVAQLSLSFGIVLLTLLLRGVVIRAIINRIKGLTAKTETDLDDRLIAALEAPAMTFLLCLGIFLAVVALPLQPEWDQIVHTLYRGATVVNVFWALFRVIEVFTDMLLAVGRRGEGKNNLEGFAPLITKSLRIFTCIVGGIMVVDNLGYNIGGILATLGIGGAALAFASKDTIANLYGSVALALDRPFQVGDWISLQSNSVEGVVEEIGLRSTKIRTFPKTLVSIPNAVLANEVINNWTRMPKRRVRHTVGLTYQTPVETVEALVEDIRTLLLQDPDVDPEQVTVAWSEFGASSLDILVQYFTHPVAFPAHLEVRQRINAKIARAVASRGSSFAYPTQTVFLQREG